MKSITLDEWEKKYIVGPVQRFDQRYTLFNRSNWDPEVKNLMDDWSSAGVPRDKPGFRLEEMALRMATDRASRMFALINTSKPNSSPLSHKIKAVMGMTNPGPAASDKPRPRVDASDTARMSRIVKKAGRFFGADLVGICRLDRRFVYSHTYSGQVPNPSLPRPEGETARESIAQEVPEECQYVVVMAYEMDR
ncbi:MAG: hypothetical protein HY667_06100, partial [Chloroflexi bacterium]|nr:hypothetical protein [Chloroflexota bacterium]